MPGEISSMQTSGAKLKVRKDSSMPGRRQKQAGMWVKTQFKQSESEEEVDARSERGGPHVCSARLPHASSLCVSLSPSCLLWRLSVSLTVPLLLCLFIRLSVLPYFLSQCLPLPHCVSVFPGLFLSLPLFLYCSSSVCRCLFLFLLLVEHLLYPSKCSNHHNTY